MSQPTGRREANKQATRAALRQAAEQLFAEQGYETTTVAQIAEAAQVGERTFYRYFESKDDLLAERAIAWIGQLQEAIRGRPAAENPYQAVARAMTALVGDVARDEPGPQAWLLSAERPLAVLRRVEPRPARRLEQAITDALLARLEVADDAADSHAPPEEAEFDAQLVARIAVAALRTALLWQRGRARPEGPGFQHVLGEAFTRLSQLAGAP
jgi:AcrR family transcriptional regulator